jgi:hypothetical protein
MAFQSKGKSNITNYDNKRIDKILEVIVRLTAALQKELMVDFSARSPTTCRRLPLLPITHITKEMI